VSTKRTILALKVVLWLGALAPGAWLVAGVFLGWLGANPIEKLTHVTGMTTLVLLLLTLTVTPLRRITGWNPVIRLRRPLGLFAFFYALGHFSIWFVFDMVFNVAWMLEDIAERPFITVGFTAFVILLPMAVTSTKGWIRRLGKRWKTLHKGIYLAATLGVVHFYWLVKADTRLPVLLGACLLVLFALRTPGLLDGISPRGGSRPARDVLLEEDEADDESAEPSREAQTVP
jgi:methionine sulfoxide reductase heme-binding subunit